MRRLDLKSIEDPTPLNSGGGDLDAFRTEAKTWLEANFPASLRKDPNAQLAAMMGGRASGDAALWQQRMGDKGWGTPTWPQAAWRRRPLAA